MTPHAAIRLSLGVAVLVFLIKLAAWWVTRSAALFSDALESIVNVLAAGAAAWALHVSAQPPDHNHPYGHTKAEYLSAVLEGALILVAAGLIVSDSWGRLFAPTEPGNLGLGLGLSALASGLNGALGWLLLRTAKTTGSPALRADAAHVLSDVASSGAVLAGLVAARLTGWWVLDPLLALLVAVHIIRVGWKVLRESVGGLMDESLPDLELATVESVLAREIAGSPFDPESVEVHDLLTRRAGPSTYIEFHLVVPGSSTVESSHALCDRLEEALLELHPRAHISIHVEPESKRRLACALAAKAHP